MNENERVEFEFDRAENPSNYVFRSFNVQSKCCVFSIRALIKIVFTTFLLGYLMLNMLSNYQVALIRYT